MQVQIAAFMSATLWVMAASAQSPAPQGTQPDPKACAPNERLVPGPRGPQVPGTTGQGDNTSDKLARTDGVICPPNLDPDIRAPTPDAGTMRVIPPPGTPGGKSDVRPK
jgi:hypothetical protein